MTIKKSIQRWGTWLLMKQFRLHEFNALFAVRDPAGLQALLAQDDQESLYAGSRGLHALRWIVFDPSRVGNVLTVGEPKALLLSLVCDGSVSGVLASVLEHAEERVRRILAHCKGFEDASDVVTYLRAHELKSQYLFRDIGPLFFPARDEHATAPISAGAAGDRRNLREDLRTALRLLFKQDPDPRPDPTLYEIDNAFAARRTFLDLLAQHGQSSAGARREAFLAALGKDGFPLPLTPFERRLPHEDSWTRRLIDTSNKVQEKAARRVPDRKLRRTIHAKGHGCIHAKLRVLGNEQGVGLFSVQRTYDAILRPSNGSELVQRDRAKDARGLALRVHIPRDAVLGSGKPPEFLPDEAGTRTTGFQDFILMSDSVFFAPNAKRLSEWFRVLEQDGGLAKAAMLLAPGGLRETWLIARTKAMRLRHPFATEYHSATSYQYGDDHIAKYSVVAKDPHRFRTVAMQKDPDSLKEALHQSLREGPIKLDFFVHLLPVNASLLAHGLTIQDVVEDATLDWKDLDVRPTHVADVEICMEEDPTTSERMREAEELRFNPWNALVEHRPLGSLNRARRTIYQKSQERRAAPEPTPVELGAELPHAAE